jgi:hypothetical protein
MSRRVVQIVPSLPPPHEGVGSCATALGAALDAGFGIESRFLVPSKDSLDEALADGGEGAPVLLHYANYGYAPRGCPSWLIEGLARWKARSRGRLVTLFHEFRASGPPWRSSFWLSPLQRRLATALMRLSDGLATTLELHARILLGWVPGREIAVLPVFSTVGEPAETLPLTARARRLVLFGGAGTRALAYRELAPEIALACRTLEIEEILDVGPQTSDVPAHVRRLGPLSNDEVSELLAGSLGGFVGYPTPFLAKSSIFAAYCAHRVLPICAWPRPKRKSDPAERPPFWTPRPSEDISSLQEIADRAHTWYGGHSLSQHAATYRKLLFP